MIPRYADKKNGENWSLAKKFARWQDVEFAVLKAREQLGRIPAGTFKKVQDILASIPIDLARIDALETLLEHDFLAFSTERSERLPIELRQYWHPDDMTSYDDEESPFAEAIWTSCTLVRDKAHTLGLTIREKSLEHPYVPMFRRTHGQGAELESFGRCCLAWYQDLQIAISTLNDAEQRLDYSRLAGMIGTNSGMDPELEKAALNILGFKPWPGSTQIMSRVMYSPVADALANIASACEKITYDFWLNSRSGRPLWHEPFKKTQKGSSAAPHKKNPIKSEQTKGMASMVRSDAACIKTTIPTAEGRDISQSCVERVKWPDIFDETLRALKNTTDIVAAMRIYPDNMIIEILESRGTYAASRAKQVLTELGLPFGLSRDEAYNIVQLASFNVFEPSPVCKRLRDNLPQSPEEMDVSVAMMEHEGCQYGQLPTIQKLIPSATLVASEQLAFTAAEVMRWNDILEQIFCSNSANLKKWETLFRPSNILKNEAYQFKVVFGAAI